MFQNNKWLLVLIIPVMATLMNHTLFASSTVSVKKQSDTLILSADTVPNLISQQFSFTEGPAVDRNGNVYFTDQPNNRIWEYDTAGRLSIFMEPAGRANGMYFDPKGNLLACADENNQLWSIAPDKKVTVLIDEVEGKKLNGPNDLWVSPSGDIYFTDPYYQRSYWKRTKPEMKGQYVYLLKKGSHKVIPVITNLKQPNGIVGTSDGGHLYVADIQANKTYRYTIQKDGSLTDVQLFTNMGSDGMTLDDHGNVYLAGKGVTVFDPQGKKIAHFPVPEDWTGNLAFGGKERNILLITASKGLYALTMKVHGIE